MSAIALPAERLSAIAAQATVKAPQHLQPLPLHYAVPVQIATISTLLWHQSIVGQPALELHLADSQIDS